MTRLLKRKSFWRDSNSGRSTARSIALTHKPSVLKRTLALLGPERALLRGAEEEAMSAVATDGRSRGCFCPEELSLRPRGRERRLGAWASRRQRKTLSCSPWGCLPNLGGGLRKAGEARLLLLPPNRAPELGVKKRASSERRSSPPRG